MPSSTRLPSNRSTASVFASLALVLLAGCSDGEKEPSSGGQHAQLGPAAAAQAAAVAEQKAAEADKEHANTLYATGRNEFDRTKAIEHFKEAAALGHAAACYELAVIYYRGGKDIPQDLPEALRWLQTGVERGDAHAQQALAWAYYTGEGIEKNPAKAEELLKLAIVQKLPSAPAALSIVGGPRWRIHRTDGKTEIASAVPTKADGIWRVVRFMQKPPSKQTYIWAFNHQWKPPVTVEYRLFWTGSVWLDAEELRADPPTWARLLKEAAPEHLAVANVVNPVLAKHDKSRTEVRIARLKEELATPGLGDTARLKRELELAPLEAHLKAIDADPNQATGAIPAEAPTDLARSETFRGAALRVEESMEKLKKQLDADRADVKRLSTVPDRARLVTEIQQRIGGAELTLKDWDELLQALKDGIK